MRVVILLVVLVPVLVGAFLLFMERLEDVLVGAAPLGGAGGADAERRPVDRR